MLQFFRDKLRGVIVWIIVSAIILAFILSAASYLFNISYNNTLVKVDGESIDLNIVNQHYQRELQQNYSKKQNLDLDSKKLKQNILNDLINQVAIIKGLERNGFLVTDEQLINFLKEDPKFQNKGIFVKQKYLNFLKTVKISDQNYQNFLRQNLLLNQFRNSILFSNVVTMDDVNNFLYKWFQVRDFGYLIIPRSKFIKTVNKEEINNYYQANKTSLLFPERIKIAYIDVSANKLKKQIVIDKNKLYNYYKEHPEYYTLPELVNVRHILIPSMSSNDNDDVKQQEQAINILSKLKSGDNFQELAKKYSKDPGSASKGGDLGWIGKGEIDDNFDAVAFALNKAGDLSEVIKSKFGYHIIQLLEKRPATVTEFAQVIEKVTQHYKEEEIQPKLNELHEKLLNASASNVDLEKLAKELNLPLNISGLFSKDGEITGIGREKVLVSAAFNQKNLNVNSEVIKLAEDHFIIFRVIDKQVPIEKSIDEAYSEIKNILESRYTTDLMNKYAEDFLAKLAKYKTSPVKLAKSMGLEWKILHNITKNSKNINEEVLTIAFSLIKFNDPKIFNLVDGDCLILQVLQIKDADLNKLVMEHPDLKSNIQEQLLQLRSYVEQKLYEQDLYNNAKIKFTKSIDQL